MANDGASLAPTPASPSAMQKLIGIIGAGPAGLAALKTVLDAPEYAAGLWAAPVVLEAREDVGGVWLPAPSPFPRPSSESSSSPSPSPPSSPPSASSTRIATTDAPSLPPTPPTPLYTSLTTNLPHPVMAFSSAPFPPCTPLFPRAWVVRAYLGAYADGFGLRRYVRFGERVVGVRWDDRSGWEVRTEKEVEDKEEDKTHTYTYTFDLLLICTGHHAAPHYPAARAMPGLAAWLAARCAFHSVFYREPGSIPLSSPESLSSTAAAAATVLGLDQEPPNEHDSDPRPGALELENATILIIGTGPSGTDIAAELAPRAGRVLVASAAYVRPPSAPPGERDGEGEKGGAEKKKEKEIEGKPLPVRFGPPPSSASFSTPSPSTSTHTRSEEEVEVEVDTEEKEELGTEEKEELGTQEEEEEEEEPGTVHFADGTRAHVDFCVLATGYEVDFPFFDQSESPSPSSSPSGVEIPDGEGPESEPSRTEGPEAEKNAGRQPRRRFWMPKGVLPRPLPADDEGDGDGDGEGGKEEGRQGRKLTNSGRAVFPLARHLFALPGFFGGAEGEGEHLDDDNGGGGQGNDGGGGDNGGKGQAKPHPTSLAFLGLPVRVAPLPLVEAQARAAVGAWAWCCGSGAEESRGELDWGREERDIRARWAALEALWAGGGGHDPKDEEERDKDAEKRAFIAKQWHRLPEDEQFAYRDALDAFAFSLRRPSIPSPFPASSSVSSSAPPSTPPSAPPSAPPSTPPSPPSPSPAPSPAPSSMHQNPHRVRPWEPRVYAQKAPLRAAWRALEARADGSAERWVEGVGLGRTPRRRKGGEKGGVDLWGEYGREGEEGKEGDTMTPEEEWVDMMERLLEWWKREQEGGGGAGGGV